MRLLSTNADNLIARLSQVQREQKTSTVVQRSVQRIIEEVRRDGDRALFRLTKEFDRVALSSLVVTKAEIRRAYRDEQSEVIRALRQAQRNITVFHKTTRMKKEPRTRTARGVTLWREFRPIERVGLYVPGGTAAYPSSVLMLAVPTQLAGCKEIVLCVPPNPDGTVPGAVLVAADLCGISRICKIGGAQAVAAMAYGTQSVPKVSKICGPGNQYVTEAKRAVYGAVDLDMPAGPSEVLVLADATARPDWVAADLLSQLEHGPDSQAILVTKSRSFAKRVSAALRSQLETLPRRAVATQSLKKSYAILADTDKTAFAFINEYAPEHVELVVKNERAALTQIINAGSVFLGPYSTEPLGDYATGANHTLPTSGYAKMFSPLSVESFGKKMQVQKITKYGVRSLKKTVEVLATREGLDAHKRAVAIRFEKLVWSKQKKF